MLQNACNSNAHEHHCSWAGMTPAIPSQPHEGWAPPAAASAASLSSIKCQCMITPWALLGALRHASQWRLLGAVPHTKKEQQSVLQGGHSGPT